MFIAKKLISRLFFPVPVCAELLVIGLILWGCTRWKRLGQALSVFGTVLLLIFGCRWAPDAALESLENRYPAVNSPSDVGAPPRYIFVLGQALRGNPDLPANLRFEEVGLQRVVEGVRLQRLFPESTLLISIGASKESAEVKERVVRDLLQIFGLSTNRLQVCSTAWDTDDEIAWCKQVASTNRVVVVSDASHLPRAMVLAGKYDLNATASPSGYLNHSDGEFRATHLFPSGNNLKNSERAVYEYLGLLWERLRGGPGS